MLAAAVMNQQLASRGIFPAGRNGALLALLAERQPRCGWNCFDAQDAQQPLSIVHHEIAGLQVKTVDLLLAGGPRLLCFRIQYSTPAFVFWLQHADYISEQKLMAEVN